MSEKTQGEMLREKLFYEPKSGFEVFDDEKIKKAYEFCEGYKKYLDDGKTERECVTEAVALLKENGFTEYQFGNKYNPGDGVYINNCGKYILAARIGENSADNGVNIIAAHIDSPRIDLKQRPLYEDSGFAFFKTHYYGGIKKYQWLALPLALHGVIIKNNGESINIKIGENESDPVLCITDLLPHLAKDQYEKKLAEAVPGESLNILLGSRPFKDSKDSKNSAEKAGDKIKLNILNMLNKKYGITEIDFTTAELSLVPAGKSKDVGLDRSMVGAYGQDDRVCAYPPLRAVIDNKNTVNTAVVVLMDKEEIGSEGNTSMKSAIFRQFLENLAEMQGVCKVKTFANSKCLSADVSAAFDPNYADVYEKHNTAFLNKGVVITKYTGSRGKSGSSDAHAEFLGYVRKILDDNNILWQTSELGKVDQGGGGTVAAYIANLNINVVDLGVGLLSMHAPFEIASKLDIYELYQTSKAFMI
jgi:aspartyl aminopeptidase